MRSSQPVVRRSRTRPLVAMVVALAVLVLAQGASAAPTVAFTAPGDITIARVNASTARLSWKAVPDAPGYRVRLAAEGQKNRYVSTAVNSLTLDTLAKNTVYTVDAFVVDPRSKTPNAALSPNSPPMQLRTSGYSRYSPDNLQVTKQRPTSVALTWDPVRGLKPGEKYLVEYALDYEMTVSRGTAGPFSGTSGTITKLPTNTTYFAKVYVVNAAKKRVSGSSELVTAKSLVPRGTIAGRVSGHTGSDVIATAYAGKEAADQVTVGADGSYVLQVRPGSYRVQVASVSTGNVAPAWAKTGSTGARVASEAGTVGVRENATSAAPEVRLGRGGEVPGEVTDPAGRQLRDVDVTALSDYTDDEREVLAVGRTGTDGSYRLRSLPDGKYWLRYRYTGDGFRTRSVNVVLKSHVITSVRVSTESTAHTASVENPFTTIKARLDLADFRKRYSVSISGRARTGSTLTADAPAWLAGDYPTTRATMTFRWKRDNTVLPGATASTYKLTSADKGRKVTVTATASRYGYRTGSTTSPGVKVS